MYCKFYHIFFFRRSQSLFPSVLISCFWYVCAKVFFLLRRVLVFFWSQWASKLYHCKRTWNWTKKTFMEFHRLKFIYVFWEGQKNLQNLHLTPALSFVLVFKWAEFHIVRMIWLQTLTRMLQPGKLSFLKFINSEKAKKICEIFTLLLTYVVPVKRRFCKIFWPSQNLWTLMNLKKRLII